MSEAAPIGQLSDRLSIGGNNPPDPFDGIGLVLRLDDEHAGVKRRTRELVDQIKQFVTAYETKGLDAAGAEAATENLRMLKLHISAVEDAHKPVKAPYWNTGKVVDGWFFGQRDELEGMATQVDKLLTGYLDVGDKVTGTYGSTAKVVEGWDVEITDPKRVPRAFCSPDLKLIKAAVKAGTTEIKGVQLTPANKTRTR